jgi:microtubule-associated protein-like 6
MIILWDWRRGEKLASARGHQDKIFDVAFDPLDAKTVTTVGVKHIKFWTHAGGGFTPTRGLFGSVAALETMMCLCYGVEAGVCYSGSATGAVYVWRAKKLIRTIDAHQGPVFTICPLQSVSFAQL